MCEWENINVWVCVFGLLTQSVSHAAAPRKKRNHHREKNIKYNLISRYAKILQSNSSNLYIERGRRGRCSARIYWNYPYKLGEGCHQLVSLKKGVNCLQISPGRLSSQDVAQLDVAAAEKIWNSIQKCSTLFGEGAAAFACLLLVYVAKYLLSCLTACRMSRSTLVPHKC